MARKFFYVCAGMLCLALAFHLGQVTAVAQVGPLVEGASIQTIQDFTYPRASACVNRYFRWMGESGGPPNVMPIPVPGTSRIVATDPNGLVMLENGNWLKQGAGGWVVIGNLAGDSGPTPALHESWGQLKSRYAPNGGTVSKGADTK